MKTLLIALLMLSTTAAAQEPPAAAKGFRFCPQVKNSHALEELNKEYAPYAKMKRDQELDKLQLRYKSACQLVWRQPNDADAVRALGPAGKDFEAALHDALGRLLLSRKLLRKADEELRSKNDKSGCLTTLHFADQVMGKEVDSMQKSLGQKFKCDK